MKQLLKSTAIYGFGNILNRLISLLLLPFFTSYLSPKDYGIQSMLSFILLFLGPIVGVGLGTSFGICYNDNQNHELNQKDGTVWGTFFILLISTVIMTCIGILFSKELSLYLFETQEYTYILVFTFISFIFSIIVLPFILHLQYEHKATLFVIISALGTVLSVASNCFFVMVLNQGIWGLVLGGLTANCGIFLMFFFAYFKNGRFAVHKKITLDLVKIGLPVVPGFAFIFILQNSWRIFLEKYDSLEALGIYTIGYNFGFVASSFVGAFSLAWTPYIFNYVDNRIEGASIFKKIYTYYYLGGGTLILLFFFFAKFIVIATTQTPFHSCYDIIGPIALAYVISGMYALYLPGAYFAKKIYLSNIALFSASLVMLSLGYFLTPVLSKWGVTIAICLAYAVLAIVQQWVNHINKLFTVTHDWKRISQYGICFIIFIFLAEIPRSFTLIQEFFYSVFLLLSYSIISLKFLTKDEIDFFKVSFRQYLPKKNPIAEN